MKKHLKRVFGEVRNGVGWAIIYFGAVIPAVLVFYNHVMVHRASVSEEQAEAIYASFILKSCLPIAGVALLLYFGTAAWFRKSKATGRGADAE